ncbi:hypothetical protein KKA15_06030 [Patescibacteria group bacterium]|nr:hypothetical protein [Patescibacteria group bacterium]
MDIQSAEFARRFPKTHKVVQALGDTGIGWEVLSREQKPDETDDQYDESMSKVLTVVLDNVQFIKEQGGNQSGPPTS